MLMAQVWERGGVGACMRGGASRRTELSLPTTSPGLRCAAKGKKGGNAPAATPALPPHVPCVQHLSDQIVRSETIDPASAFCSWINKFSARVCAGAHPKRPARPANGHAGAAELLHTCPGALQHPKFVQLRWVVLPLLARLLVLQLVALLPVLVLQHRMPSPVRLRWVVPLAAAAPGPAFPFSSLCGPEG